MKTTRLLVIGICVLGAAGLAYHFYPRQTGDEASAPVEVTDTGTPATTTDDPVLARVNGTPVHKSELIPYLQDLASNEQLLQWGRLESIPPELFETALLNLTQDRLVRQLADEAQITQRPEVQALMEKSSNRIAKLAYLDQLTPGLVDEAGIRQRYDELVASLQGKKEYRARHILLKDEQEAGTILQALESRPFGELAKLFSLDENTGLRGGDLGYFLLGTLDEEFESQLTRLEPGTVSRPFQTRYGWHVAILDDVRDATPMPFEQAAPLIRQQLERQATQAWLDQLVAKAEIVPAAADNLQGRAPEAQ